MVGWSVIARCEKIEIYKSNPRTQVSAATHRKSRFSMDRRARRPSPSASRSRCPRGIQRSPWTSSRPGTAHGALHVPVANLAIISTHVGPPKQAVKSWRQGGEIMAARACCAALCSVRSMANSITGGTGVNPTITTVLRVVIPPSGDLELPSGDGPASAPMVAAQPSTTTGRSCRPRGARRVHARAARGRARACRI